MFWKTEKKHTKMITALALSTLVVVSHAANAMRDEKYWRGRTQLSEHLTDITKRYGNKLIEAVNQQRAALHLPAVKACTGLSNLCRDHTAYMANSGEMTHDGFMERPSYYGSKVQERVGKGGWVATNRPESDLKALEMRIRYHGHKKAKDLRLKEDRKEYRLVRLPRGLQCVLDELCICYENLAMNDKKDGTFKPKHMVKEWMKSDKGHREALLSADSTLIGFKIYCDDRHGTFCTFFIGRQMTPQEIVAGIVDGKYVAPPEYGGEFQPTSGFHDQFKARCFRSPEFREMLLDPAFRKTLLSHRSAFRQLYDQYPEWVKAFNAPPRTRGSTQEGKQSGDK